MWLYRIHSTGIHATVCFGITCKTLKKKNDTVTFDELMLKALIFVLFWTLRPQFVSGVPVA